MQTKSKMISKNQIKYIRQLEQKKFRKRENCFVAEGPKVVGDLMKRYQPKAIFATRAWLEGAGIGSQATEITDEELRELDVKIPLLEGSIEDAKATLTEMQMKYEVIGNGIEVVSQYPVTGTAMAKNSTVYLITEKSAELEKTTVPSFNYLDLANANALAEQYGLNIAVSGASPSAVGATVDKQSIEYGSTVTKGTVIELEFKIPEVKFAD